MLVQLGWVEVCIDGEDVALEVAGGKTLLDVRSVKFGVSVGGTCAPAIEDEENVAV
jgi:hypothetical protein